VSVKIEVFLLYIGLHGKVYAHKL